MSKIFETTYVNIKKVKCEGESDTIGHPLVYLEMGDDDKIVCPYCSHLFVFKD